MVMTVALFGLGLGLGLAAAIQFVDVMLTVVGAVSPD